MIWGHLTWPGNLTLRVLGLKFSQHMRKRCMIMCGKNGGAARRIFCQSEKNGRGGALKSSPSGRGLTHGLRECDLTLTSGSTVTLTLTKHKVYHSTRLDGCITILLDMWRYGTLLAESWYKTKPRPLGHWPDLWSPAGLRPYILS